MQFRRLEDADLSGKTALVRVDFNVPRCEDGTISDDTRIQAALPTIRAIREAGGKVVLLSHFGRPNGEAKAEFSLKFLLPVLEQHLGEVIGFTGGDDPVSIKENITLLENTRFHPGETKGEDALAKEWAKLGDIFVQDAFSASHRNHVSSAGLANYLPAYAGLAMERELDHLSQALENPASPVLGVVGGAKVSTKIDLLSNLVEKLDMLAIGGGMANTFLAAQGYDVGKSLCEHDLKDTALKIMDTAHEQNCRILLPIDVVAATEFAAHAPHRVCGLDEVGENEMILDAGPETVNGLADAIDRAKTLIWNGPLGAFEIPPFDTSTFEAAQYAAKRVKRNGLIAVAGGGDTVAALKHAGAAQDFTFISTAGGAFLEWMEGKSLPGVEILTGEVS
ncbi:MAG: phosphoglycerate kinase [Hellea sp.]|nr:phosphoglycerate kinase [Hellea sp.]